ncbi:hypothetical protein [Wolbachia endosymbiont of Cantharis cryptica]|uniref:hypothetical protein n=1 Tax=Wolbachia endosymbiont of Cantharis cryptica TaxID=3066132 RepID=UPI00376F00FA
MRIPKLLQVIAKKLKRKEGTSVAKGADTEESRASNMQEGAEGVLEVKEQKETANIVDKATGTDTQLCNKNKVLTEQELNASESPSPAEIELCFDSDAAGKEENPLTKATQQRRAIVAGSAGVMLLVSSVVSYILKMHIIAVVAGIVGLAFIGCALYNTLNPNTKLEKVEKIEQLDLPSPSL